MVDVSDFSSFFCPMKIDGVVQPNEIEWNDIGEVF
jgi:hypothetical protein